MVVHVPVDCECAVTSVDQSIMADGAGRDRLAAARARRPEDGKEESKMKRQASKQTDGFRSTQLTTSVSSLRSRASHNEVLPHKSTRCCPTPDDETRGRKKRATSDDDERCVALRRVITYNVLEDYQATQGPL